MITSVICMEFLLRRCAGLDGIYTNGHFAFHSLTMVFEADIMDGERDEASEKRSCQ